MLSMNTEDQNHKSPWKQALLFLFCVMGYVLEAYRPVLVVVHCSIIVVNESPASSSNPKPSEGAVARILPDTIWTSTPVIFHAWDLFL